LERQALLDDKHELIEHESLLSELREAIRGAEKAERSRAIQALRYATRRKEGLVSWRFDTTGVERKDLISWARSRVQVYFTRLR
jgi:hypothetical protein